MDYKKIKRLNESHETISPEVLNMTIGEFLDRAGEMDTAGNAEYEVIEDAIKALSMSMDAGYPREQSLDDIESVEAPEEKEVDFTEEDEMSEVPTFADAETSLANEKPSGTEALDSFNF